MKDLEVCLWGNGWIEFSCRHTAARAWFPSVLGAEGLGEDSLRLGVWRMDAFLKLACDVHQL